MSKRSIVRARPARSELTADTPLKFWTELIRQAVVGAKRTRCGLPTDSAILDHWWIQTFRPLESDPSAWEYSFPCACMWLDKDVDKERARCIAEIDDAWSEAAVRHAGSVTYARRAIVLTVAGIPTTIARQFAFAFYIREEEYEDLAGIDRPDPLPSMRKRQLALGLPEMPGGLGKRSRARSTAALPQA